MGYGFRIDVAHGMVKAPGLPDIEENLSSEMLAARRLPFWDQDGVHEIYRNWRRILNSYPGDRMAVAEAWVSPASRIALYLRPDELANSFNFDFLTSIWDIQDLKRNIDLSLQAIQSVGAPASWVFNNHDVVRSVDRFALGLRPGVGETTFDRHGDVSKLNLEIGIRRARSGALLMLALPGGAYIYQGEELALPEVRDIPEDRLEDPRWFLSEKTDKGRDGCRVPLPWSSNESGSFGFSINEKLGKENSWLPQPNWWGNYSAENQEHDPNSTLNIYRRALAVRKKETGLGDGPMEWLNTRKDVVAFSRPGNFACYINYGPDFELPKDCEVLVASGPLKNHVLPTDTAVWVRTK